MLKKKLRDFILTIEELRIINKYGNILLQLETILVTRWIKKKYLFVEESLVKWKHLSIEEATWEKK